MKFNIGDKVNTKNGVGIVTDKMYSEKTNVYYYCVTLEGKDEEEDTLFVEEDLTPWVEVQYVTETEVCGNVVVGVIYKVDSYGKKEFVARGHGHLLHNGEEGILQAISYAYLKAYQSTYGNESKGAKTWQKLN